MSRVVSKEFVGRFLIALIIVVPITVFYLRAQSAADRAVAKADAAKAVAVAVEHEREARIVQNCEAQNASAVVQIEAEKIEVRNLVNALAPPPRSGPTNVRVLLFLRSQYAAIRNAHPLHSCSLSALGITPLTEGGGASGVTPTTKREAFGHPPPSGAATTICQPEGKSGRCHKP